MSDTFALLKQGGWLMIPLGLCSLAGLAIVIERFVALRRGAVIDPRIVRLVDEYDADMSLDRAILTCHRSRGPFARVIAEIVKARHLHHSAVIETMHATGRTQVAALERGLTLLEIIAGISPLLGLLGTVLGMVDIFNAITTHGIGNAQVLSAGISQALITTIAGLSIAIPALAFHSWLSRRVEDYATEMQDRATGFIAKLHGLSQDI